MKTVLQLRNLLLRDAGTPAIVIALGAASVASLITALASGAVALLASALAIVAIAAAGAVVMLNRRYHVALKEVVELSNAAIVVYDETDRLVVSNDFYLRALNLSRETMTPGTPYREIVLGAISHIEDPVQREAELKKRLSIQARSNGKLTERTYAGGRVLRVTKTRTPRGNSVGVGIDVTEAHTLRNRLRDQVKIFQAVADATPAGLLHIDRAGQVVFANRTAYAMCRCADLQDFDHVRFERDKAGIAHSLCEIVNESEHREVEVRVVAGSERCTQTLIVRQALVDNQDDAAPFDGPLISERLILLIDITERKADEERIRYLASRDPMTGARNRTAFTAQLEAAGNAANGDRPTHLIAIDLDKFKPINDRYGHMAGDTVLCEIVRRMTDVLHPNMTLFRMGGDEFAIICEPGADTPVEAFSRELLDAIEQPISVAGHSASVSASIGISSFPTDTEELESLIRYADLALYAVKDKGGGRTAVYGALDGTEGHEFAAHGVHPPPRNRQLA